MSCCSISSKNFTNESVTTMSYVGDRPKVKVVYLDPGTGEWGYLNPLTRIGILGGVIQVDHGGPTTGIIQIVQ